MPSLYLAPFQGITGVTFRSVYTRNFQGIDKLYTPFFNGIHNETKLPARKLAELGQNFENGIEVVPQILSKEPDEIIRFARLCHNLGFSELNWNLGCPYPQVANKKRGSGMLPYPEMVDNILQKAMIDMPVRFTIKCRLGYGSSAEIFNLVPIFNNYPIAEITIHARIGKQLYSGFPDRDLFQKAMGLIHAPVVYNGDIFSVDDFNDVNNSFETISHWMIGRGILSDPFLPAKIKNLPVANDQQTYMRKFIGEIYLAYRKQMNDNLAALGVLKEYWHYLSESFDDPHKVFKKLKKVNRFDEYEDAVRFIFDEYQWLGSGKRLS